MERRIEIYRPGYLFEGTRPVIYDVPLTINYGEENIFDLVLDVENDPEILIDSIVLISMPSVTHCFDSNQRYVVLDFETISVNKFSVTPPADRYIAPPGYYMLFVLKDKSQSWSEQSKIPSIAKIIKLEVA